MNTYNELEIIMDKITRNESVRDDIQEIIVERDSYIEQLHENKRQELRKERTFKRFTDGKPIVVQGYLQRYNTKLTTQEELQEELQAEQNTV